MDLGFSIAPEALSIAAGTVLLLALAAALAASKRRTGLFLTPVTLFFIFAVAHAFFGRYIAFITTKYTSVGPDTLEPFINQSFSIISTGLVFCFLTYALLPSSSSSRLADVLSKISCSRALGQVCVRSRILVLICVPLIVIGLQRLGGIPLLSDNVRQSRYLLNFLPDHRFDAFLVNRGREMIVIPMAGLVLGLLCKRRSLVDALFVVLAVAGCLLTATRSPILTGTLFVLVILIWKRNFSAVVLTVVAIVAGLVASEAALGDSMPNAGEIATLERIGSDVGEVRDLGWILSRQDERYWGLTFLAGALPIPSFASDFTETFHLRTVTLNAIGFSLYSAHGGLRITYSGEWFLNFGWAGVIVGGVLYGWLCSRFSGLFHRLRRDSWEHPVGGYMLACAWVACSFMLYVSGSATGGTVKTYAGVLVVLAFRLRRRRRLQAPWQQPEVLAGASI
jgi:oligosaccharide repeat unit polymerase